MDQFASAEGRFFQLPLLIPGHVRIMLDHVLIRREKEAAGAARRIADRLSRLRRNDIDHPRNQRTWREVLPGSRLHVLRVLLQQPLVGIALHVRAHHRPVFLVDQIDDQPPQLRRVLKLVLGLIEDQTEQALLVAELLQDVTVMIEQFIAVFLDQRRPTVLRRNRAWFVIRRLRPLIRHFEKQQIRQLLDVIAIAHPVVAQDVTVVPEFLDDCRGCHTALLISVGGIIFMLQLTKSMNDGTFECSC